MYLCIERVGEIQRRTVVPKLVRRRGWRGASESGFGRLRAVRRGYIHIDTICVYIYIYIYSI